MITPIFWIVPIASLLALSLAFFFYKQMMKESEGTEMMAKIASHVREGAMSYLKQQYKVVASVFVFLLFYLLLWPLVRGAERVGTRCLPYRRFLFRIGRFLRNENSDVCLCQNGKCCPHITQQRFADRLP
jgi:hypothetical protein